MAFYDYYGVKDDYIWHYRTQTSIDKMSVYWRNIPKLFAESDLVWRQGPRGGVKLIKQTWESVCENHGKYRKYGYATTDEKSMSEFCWIKLKAVTIND